ncbi:MFS transporter [Corynebacterium lubricantis]|uniref:MFS transporter n=1 Tax=Corynebacterium lubricantis TaxID=541095 RepID=UPI002480F390|nr:MFS transporter [Corynebacterium lubricantis]
MGTDGQASPAEASQTKRSRWLALTAMSVGYFFVMLDQAVVPVLTPHLPSNVGDSVWITSIYLLCTVVPMLVTGRMGDRYGQRNLYLAGIAVYSLGLALAAAAPSFALLIIARGLQGLGAAAFLPQAFSVIGKIFPDNSRGPAFAMWGVVGSVGSLIGPVFAGIAVDTIGWRGAFGIQAGLGLIACGLAWAWIPKMTTSSARIDAPSVIVSFLGLGALVYGIQYGNIVALVVGIIALALFFRLQAKHGDQALLPLSVFRNRNFTLASLGIATMGFAAAAQFIPIMFWLQDARGIDATTAGWLTVPMSIVALLLTPVVGVLADRVNPKILSTIGFGVLALSMLWTWWLMVSSGSVYWMIVITALKGVGSAFIWAPNATTAMRTIPRHLAGAASGAYNTVRQVGSVVGVALIGATLSVATPTRGIDLASADAMLILTAAMLIGVIASVFLRSDIPRRNR